MGSSVTKYKPPINVGSIGSNRSDDITEKLTEGDRSYVPKVGLERALSVISSLNKDPTSGEVHGLRHRNNQGNVIKKHLLKAEKHRKTSKGFGISSRNISNQWFVLYDDSRNPIGGNDDMLGTILCQRLTTNLALRYYA